MNKELSQKNQIFSILAVFLFGNLIISFPKGEGLKHSFWGYIACFTLSVFILLLLSLLQYKNINFGIECFEGLTGMKVIFKGLLVLFALLCLLVCCKDYVEMVDEIRLQNTPRWGIAVIYILVVLLLSQTKKRVIAMFAFVNLIFISIGVILMFLFSLPLFNFDYFIESLDFNVNNAVTQGLTFYIHSFGQLILCLLFFGHQKRKYAVKNGLYGILIGGTVFLICFVNIIFVIGSDIIPKLHFPYANVTGMIVTGENYNRLDAITYYIYFICDLIKASILLKIITECFKKNKTKKWIVIFFSLLISVIFSSSETLGGLLRSDAVNLTLLILEIIFPLILIFVLKKKTKPVPQK